jgi:hypothetical protein
MKKALPFFAFCIAFFYLLNPTQISAKVWINEFSSASDPEWVEIYNDGNEKIDLTEWQLVDENDKADDINLEGCIESKSYRSFNSVVKYWLNNGGDIIYLINSDNVVVDQVDYGNEADIGTPKSEESARREPPGSESWVIDSNTSKRDDNCKPDSPTNTPTNKPTESPTDTPTETLKPTNSPTPDTFYQDYDNIYISEVMADPESGEEWVELYNDNDFQVDLDGWYIDDVADGGGTPISISGLIDPKSYYAFEVAVYFFNNNGDDVRLLNHKKEEKDFRTYDYSEKGVSWADVYNSWCQAEPSKNLPNESCLQEEKPTPTASKTPTLTPIQSPTLTPIITKTPTPTPGSSLTPTKNPSPTSVSTLKTTPEVLGESLDIDENEIENKTRGNLIAGGFVGAGGLVLAGAGFSPQIKSFFDKMSQNEE